MMADVKRYLDETGLAALVKHIKSEIAAVGSGGTGSPSVMSAGVILPFAGVTIPSGFLVCDGGAYSRTEYAVLFAVIGTRYGVGNGSTTFNVPNFSGRVPVGVDAGHALASAGGEETHRLTISETPAHTHAFTGASHSHSIPSLSGSANSAGAHKHGWNGYVGSGSMSGSSNVVALFGNDSAQSYLNQGRGPQSAGAHTHSVTTTASTSGQTTTAGVNASAGEGRTHNNMQPYLVINYIVSTGKAS